MIFTAADRIIFTAADKIFSTAASPFVPPVHFLTWGKTLPNFSRDGFPVLTDYPKEKPKKKTQKSESYRLKKTTKKQILIAYQWKKAIFVTHADTNKI